MEPAPECTFSPVGMSSILRPPASHRTSWEPFAFRGSAFPGAPQSLPHR